MPWPTSGDRAGPQQLEDPGLELEPMCDMSCDVLAADELDAEVANTAGIAAAAAAATGSGELGDEKVIFFRPVHLHASLHVLAYQGGLQGTDIILQVFNATKQKDSPNTWCLEPTFSQTHCAQWFTESTAEELINALRIWSIAGRDVDEKSGLIYTVNCPMPLVDRRSHVPMDKLTTLELIIELANNGWKDQETPSNVRTLFYREDEADPKVWYQCSDGTVCRMCLLCLAGASDLVKKGVKSIYHGQLVSYYTALWMLEGPMLFKVKPGEPANFYKLLMQMANQSQEAEDDDGMASAPGLIPELTNDGAERGCPGAGGADDGLEAFGDDVDFVVDNDVSAGFGSMSNGFSVHKHTCHD
jgi:hypothetical protein